MLIADCTRAMRSHTAPETGIVLAILPDANERAAFKPAVPASVETAGSASEALRILRSHNVGVLVCDETLPDARWQDVFESLAALEEPPPFVLVSRLADERLWVDVLDAGVYDLLAKPFHAGETNRVLRIALREWQHQRAPNPKVFRPDRRLRWEHGAEVHHLLC